MQCINERLLENIETSKTFYLSSVSFTIQQTCKTTALQNVTQRRKSSASVHSCPDVGHGISGSRIACLGGGDLAMVKISL